MLHTLATMQITSADVSREHFYRQKKKSTYMYRNFVSDLFIIYWFLTMHFDVRKVTVNEIKLARY